MTPPVNGNTLGFVHQREMRWFQTAGPAAIVVEMIGDPNEEKVELVCPLNDEHRLWYPVGLLDVEPSPWCMCIPIDSTSKRDNPMRPANSPDRRTSR